MCAPILLSYVAYAGIATAIILLSMNGWLMGDQIEFFQ